jgi:hypothetical protein
MVKLQNWVVALLRNSQEVASAAETGFCGLGELLGQSHFLNFIGTAAHARLSRCAESALRSEEE